MVLLSVKDKIPQYDYISIKFSYFCYVNVFMFYDSHVIFSLKDSEYSAMIMSIHFKVIYAIMHMFMHIVSYSVYFMY